MAIDAGRLGGSDDTSEGLHSFDALVKRLARASVTRGSNAYLDVDWDAAEHTVEDDDPRWQLPPWDALGSTGWYRDQSASTRSRVGLDRVAGMMQVGIQFEAVLAQGLLNFASTLESRSPAFRYVYHEIAEEAQHSLMFQEFINRSGSTVREVVPEASPANETVVRLGRELPALFFLVALAGEEPFDQYQRKALADGTYNHPLLIRIHRIHAVEEARHISFARGYLRACVPKLSSSALRRVQYQAAPTVGRLVNMMLGVPWSLAESWGMPEQSYQEMLAGDAEVARRRQGVRGIYGLCRDIGIATPRVEPLWRNLVAAVPACEEIPRNESAVSE